ncbi:peptidase S8/S53 domain-containing protein [Lasiosphaeris hirsuta]|uniref:Peptidase S8/S53 domain-containing protein n=1 Tax=Lasiosphaeris hirsuta TaxID=260670 RepID=A0AA40ANI5_9PEZI|nr:peptidase S8/S53 domain-containing protein [Lasiosphaeris hirsuta]
MSTTTTPGNEPLLGDETTKLSIKLTDSTFQRHRGEPTQFLAGLVRTANPQFLEGVEVLVEPAITSVSADEVDALVVKATELDPAYIPVNFSSWFSAVLVAQGIALASPPATVFPDDDPDSSKEGYLNTAPQGIDSRYAWTKTGGDGVNGSIVDVEWDWLLDHPDLVAANIAPVEPPLEVADFDKSHGTAVLGEMFMVDNTIGGVGIVPKGRGRVSQIKRGRADGVLDAIFAAIKAMEFGEIMLIEVQVGATNGQGEGRWYPVEVYDQYYNSLRLATALGITVVEAGGNGGTDLDGPVSTNGAVARSILNRNHPDFRDSGAIVVGGSTSSVPHRRIAGGNGSATNYGNRIDVYSWFENIFTTAIDGDGYTRGFGGTSGASPIVTGAAAVMQSIAQANLGFNLTPLQVRRLIGISGTSTFDPAFDKLGTQPNLRGIIDGQYLNLPPDLYVRDVVGDDGSPRSGAVTYTSPDIIVRQAQAANPAAQFGAGSGTENSDTLSQPTRPGQTHFVYIRARNRGATAAQDAFTDVYWTRLSTILAPETWQRVGRATFSAAVPTGNVLTVSDVLRWQAPAEIVDPVFIAVAGSREDPAPLTPPPQGSSAVDLSRFFRQNNNVAGRNVQVAGSVEAKEEGTDVFKSAFIVQGAADTNTRFALKTRGQLPLGSKVLMRAPLDLTRALGIPLRPGAVAEGGNTADIPLNPLALTDVGEGVLAKDSSTECELVVEVPRGKLLEGGIYSLVVSQEVGGEEVGRATILFGKP